MIRAGAVANPGIAKKIGENIKDNKNKIAVDRAVSPVLPPSATPAALSTKVVTVDVPNTAPTEVAMASDSSAGFIFGSLPSLSSISAFVDTPISVPIVSNKSTNKNDISIPQKEKVAIFENSNLNAIGSREGIAIPFEKSGINE